MKNAYFFKQVLKRRSFLEANDPSQALKRKMCLNILDIYRLLTLSLERKGYFFKNIGVLIFTLLHII
jgi:hypothetical protein